MTENFAAKLLRQGPNPLFERFALMVKASSAPAS